MRHERVRAVQNPLAVVMMLVFVGSGEQCCRPLADIAVRNQDVAVPPDHAVGIFGEIRCIAGTGRRWRLPRRSAKATGVVRDAVCKRRCQYLHAPRDEAIVRVDLDVEMGELSSATCKSRSPAALREIQQNRAVLREARYLVQQRHIPPRHDAGLGPPVSALPPRPSIVPRPTTALPAAPGATVINALQDLPVVVLEALPHSSPRPTRRP